MTNRAPALKPGVSQIVTDTGSITQAWSGQIGAAIDAINGPFPLRIFSPGNVPSAARYSGGLILVNDVVGGPYLAVSDGTNWNKIKLGLIIA